MAQQLADLNVLPSKITRDLIDPLGGYHVARICSVLGVGKAEFARFSDRRTESVAKLFNRDTVKPRSVKTLQVLGEMTQIVTILRAMGLLKDAKRWMKTPIPSFSGRTPSDLIEEGRGQELIDRLIANATGNVGS